MYLFTRLKFFLKKYEGIPLRHEHTMNNASNFIKYCDSKFEIEQQTNVCFLIADVL